MMSKCDFNASIYVSEQLNRQLINMSQDLAYRCVDVLAERYNFDAEEAYHLLGLEMIKVERKAQINAKVSGKAPKVSMQKAAFPLPYNGELNDSCCYALRHNNGLYTQCTGVRKGEAQFCKCCATLMQKTGGEVPEYGTIQQRMAVGIFEYVDPKGRKPIAYTKVMKKYKISEEQVLEEAGKLNIIINKGHFVVPDTFSVNRGRPKTKKEPKAKGVKGRPKKMNKVIMIEGDDEDLFATLVAEANNESENLSVTSKSKTTDGKKNEPDGKKNAPDGKKNEKEKEAERQAKEAEKEAERQAKEAEKEAKRLAAELAKKEKEAKLAAEKAEKEAKKEAERLAREEKKKAEEAEKVAKRIAAEITKKEKEAKLAALAVEKAEKLAKLAALESEKLMKKSQKTSSNKAVPEQVEDEEPDIVKKIEFEGKKYLKSKKTGIIYDYNEYVKNGEQLVVGKWNDTTNKIEFSADEEEEEEYDL